MSVNDEISAILESPGTSYWLKHALDGAMGRDIVDAANDAELLSSLLSRRCTTSGPAPATFSFRAETLDDAAQFLQAARELGQTLTATVHLDDVSSDIEVEISTTTTLHHLQETTRRIPDGEVIRQSLRVVPLALNSLERDPAL